MFEALKKKVDKEEKVKKIERERKVVDNQISSAILMIPEEFVEQAQLACEKERKERANQCSMR